jgi:small subunit ribosomal protein S20
MAHHKSAEKRNRQSQKRRLRNKTVKTGVRAALKKLDAVLDAGNVADAEKLLAVAVSKLDRAYSKGVMKRGTTSRRISRIRRKVTAARAGG